jgi:hypothetical protein
LADERGAVELRAERMKVPGATRSGLKRARLMHGPRLLKRGDPLRVT